MGASRSTASLLERLDQAGLLRSVHDRLRVLRVAGLRPRWESSALRDALRATLARDEREQATFARAYEGWLREGEAPTDAPPVEPRRRAVVAAVLLGAALLCALVIALYTWNPVRVDPHPTPGPVAPGQPQAPATPGTDPRAPRRALECSNDVVEALWCHRIDHYRPWVRTAGVGALLGAAGALALGLWWARRNARRRYEVEKARYAALPAHRRERQRSYRPGPQGSHLAPPPELAAWVADEPGFDELVAALGGRALAMEGDDVDLDATVRATVEALGLPTIVRRQGSGSPREVLVALDRSDSEASWLPVAEAFLTALTLRGVRVSALWFDGTLARCGWDCALEQAAEFSDVAAGCDLVIAVGPGTSGGDFEGDPALWVLRALSGRRQCAWLVPLPPRHWGPGALAIARVVPVLPFCVDAWVSVARDEADQYVVDDPRPALTRGVLRAPESPFALGALEHHLGPVAFACLAHGAVAAAPSEWAAVTQGLREGPRPSLDDLLRLVGLPVWRWARWPAKLREGLVARLADEADTRRRWLSQLTEVEPVAHGSIQWLRWRIDVLEQEIALEEPVAVEAAEGLVESPLAELAEPVITRRPSLAEVVSPRELVFSASLRPTNPSIAVCVVLVIFGAGAVAERPAWTRAAAAASPCESGWLDCNGATADGCEVDRATDAANCGRCGVRCSGGARCREGICSLEVAPCRARTTRCGDACVDLQTDASNCGVCGVRCQSGASCARGSCTASVPTTGVDVPPGRVDSGEATDASDADASEVPAVVVPTETPNRRVIGEMLSRAVRQSARACRALAPSGIYVQVLFANSGHVSRVETVDGVTFRAACMRNALTSVVVPPFLAPPSYRAVYSTAQPVP